jgi:hypothetical protein
MKFLIIALLLVSIVVLFILFRLSFKMLRETQHKNKP